MIMRFCPKCGGMMAQKEQRGEMVFVCMRCGHVEKGTRKVQQKEKAEVPVIEERTKSLPTTKVECPKCGNDRACWWIQQTRAADEPSTRFYKCTKCGHVWREYS